MCFVNLQGEAEQDRTNFLFRCPFDLGADCSRVRTAMAQQITDLGQGRSLLEVLGRQAVAKQ
jgi:hypothetical protein